MLLRNLHGILTGATAAHQLCSVYFQWYIFCIHCLPTCSLLDQPHAERVVFGLSLGERTVEGFYKIKGGIESAIARGLAYAPYADLLWFETSEPNLDEAKQFAAAIHEKYPGKMLSYNCSPSFNWKKKLDDATIAKFQQTLGELGYKFQVSCRD